ncbi:MAG: ABC transporter ATP-binding protein [Deltaproteobacteria bacterium]|nr:ABC transporter ATP-binding protein [Deltaproteobacteria bacterium]
MQIELRSVHKRYGDVDVVADLSLLLPAGQVTALLGPSGCGKTTTLRMIAGLERCTAGSIRIGDRVVDDAAAGIFVPPEERGLGMVFQSYALWPHKTVLENVAYPLTLRGGKSKAVVVEQAMRALQRVRLHDLAQRAPHQLSGGQQQRVAVARALVGDGERAPPVLLLDEPLANLDARLREDMRAELAAIARTSGATVVAVTHDQQEAFALADAVVVLERGRLAQRGSPEEIYLHPRSPFVGSFGGPMAFLDAVAPDAGGAVDVAGWSMPRARVSGECSGRVQLGVRPEWMVPGEAGVVVVVEQRLFLGREHEVSVVTAVGGIKLTLRVPSTSPAPAVGARLQLELSRACAFPPPL